VFVKNVGSAWRDDQHEGDVLKEVKNEATRR
jgi:hypothetical protein